jgi:glutathione peroxidase
MADSAHDFAFRGIDGGELPLADFAGRAVLLVNTASECGYTPQYSDLQRLWERYRERGLVVLGVPSNDFGAQEPGDEAAIGAFCRERYRVDFPLSSKVRVIGADAHPFYRWVQAELGEDAAPRWNFHKYLLSRDGEILGLWPSQVGPLDEPIVAAVEEALG